MHPRTDQVRRRGHAAVHENACYQRPLSWSDIPGGKPALRRLIATRTRVYEPFISFTRMTNDRGGTSSDHAQRVIESVISSGPGLNLWTPVYCRTSIMLNCSVIVHSTLTSNGEMRGWVFEYAEPYHAETGHASVPVGSSRRY